MRIVRAHEAQNWTTLPNSLIQDQRLSFGALGLLTWLLHLPPSWEVGGHKEIAKQRREGQVAIRRLLTELEEAGYLTRMRRQDRQTGRWETVSEVRAVPLDAEVETARSPEKRHPPRPAETQCLPRSRRGSQNRASVNRASETRAVPKERSSSTKNLPPTPQAAAEEDQQSEKLLAELPEPWRTSPGQRRRLVPLVRAALAAGWPEKALREELSQNSGGVLHPGAVLSSRLKDLPEPPRQRQAAPRPTWCRKCDERTRQISTDDDRVARCPDCHPATAQKAPRTPETP